MSQVAQLGALDAATLDLIDRCVVSVLSTMVGARPHRSGLELDRHPPSGNGIAAMVGITGPVTGVIVLGFPAETAMRCAASMLGCEFAAITDEVCDAMAELANMVGGSAKSKLGIEPPPSLSLPTVIEGYNYRVCYPSKSTWVRIPYESDLGPFSVHVSLNRG
ncbi:MAG: chemotaxis protein CheX [Phycisphaerae bacterium]